ncbi:MFS transporter [Pseudomonas aeruginosa]|nr:MFS transporter [Pseudomonas aeruginosa]HBP6730515.1 MFS transporter [Pseudomonas aeruginosa]
MAEQGTGLAGHAGVGRFERRAESNMWLPLGCCHCRNRRFREAHEKVGAGLAGDQSRVSMGPSSGRRDFSSGATCR